MVSTASAPFYIPPTVHKVPISPPSHQHLLSSVCVYLIIATPMGVMWSLIVVLICIP